MYKPFSWGTALCLLPLSDLSDLRSMHTHNYLNTCIHVIGNKKHMEENSSTACMEGGFLHEVRLGLFILP